MFVCVLMLLCGSSLLSYAIMHALRERSSIVIYACMVTFFSSLPCWVSDLIDGWWWWNDLNDGWSSSTGRLVLTHDLTIRLLCSTIPASTITMFILPLFGGICILLPSGSLRTSFFLPICYEYLLLYRGCCLVSAKEEYILFLTLDSCYCRAWGHYYYLLFVGVFSWIAGGI